MPVLNMIALGTNSIAKGWTSFAVGFLVLLLPDIGHATEAGKFEFVMGDVRVISATGVERLPLRGENFNEGDTVVSEEARVQLRFTDGAFISLAPHSRFHIKEYTYNGVADGAEKITMELLRGALRTITGLIGKKNKAAYVMQTTVATIGIRGTEYSISYLDGITGTVSGGWIVVCNAGGCLDVIKDQSYYVRDAATKPVLTEKAVFLPPPQPTRQSTEIARSAAQNEAEADADILSGSAGDGEKKGKDKNAKDDAKNKGKGKNDGVLLTAEVSKGQDKAKENEGKAPKAENGKAELASSSKKQSADPMLALPLDKVSEGGAKDKGANNPGLDSKELITADFKSFTSIGADFQSKGSDTSVDSLSNGATEKLAKGAGNAVDKGSQSQADTKALSTSLGDIGLVSALNDAGKGQKIKLDDPIFSDIGNGKKGPKLK
jgi:hypothetical protein